MNEVKGLIESKTFWANVVGGLLFLLHAMGKNVDIDPGSLVDWLVSASGIIVSGVAIWGRVVAKDKIVQVLPVKKE